MDHCFNCMQQARSGPLTTINYFPSNLGESQETFPVRRISRPPLRSQPVHQFSSGGRSYRSRHKHDTSNGMEFFKTLQPIRSQLIAPIPRRGGIIGSKARVTRAEQAYYPCSLSTAARPELSAMATDAQRLIGVMMHGGEVTGSERGRGKRNRR